MNIHHERNKILKILEFLSIYAQNQYNLKHTELKNSTHCLESLAKTIESCF